MASTTSAAVPIIAVMVIFVAAYFMLRRSRKRDDDWLTRDQPSAHRTSDEQPAEMNWHPGRDYDLTMKEWLEINSRRDV